MHPDRLSPRILRSQRWRDRRSRFVANDTTIDPAELSVDAIPFSVARQFCHDNHYLPNTPPMRFAAGLFRNGPGGSSRLVGVSCFSVPMNPRAVPLHTGLPPDRGVELGRFTLLDDIAANGETYFLSRAFRLLRSALPDIEAVLSYADPMPRRDAAGQVTAIGHWGCSYQAANAAYRGQRPKRSILLLPNGQVFSDRTASKIRNSEVGHAYAVDQLVQLGAPKPMDRDLAEWWADLLAGSFFQRIRAPGVHDYTFALTRRARLTGATRPSSRPPKPDRHPGASDITALPLFSDHV